MKFNDVRFRHPVLGLRDEINGKAELLLSEITPTQDFYSIALRMKIENSDLERLVDNKKAEYACEVTCTNTLYRKFFSSESGEINFEIDRKDVKGSVEFACFLVANENIEKYSNSSAHPDYDGYFFNLEKGDILAFFNEFSFDADIKYEKLKSVSSFMEIIEDEKADYMAIDLKKDKIEVKLPTKQYQIYRKDAICKEEKFSPLFHSSVVLNTLLVGLQNLKEHEDFRWAKAIKYRLENEDGLKNLNISDKESINEIAQQLLGNPFERMLNSINTIVNAPDTEEE